MQAILSANEIVNENTVLTLTPEVENIHTYIALKNTILLDVLIPPYNKTDRQISYY